MSRKFVPTGMHSDSRQMVGKVCLFEELVDHIIIKSYFVVVIVFILISISN